MEGERRWDRVLRATCLEDEATNLRSKPMEAEGSCAVAMEEIRRWPCLVSSQNTGGGVSPRPQWPLIGRI